MTQITRKEHDKTRSSQFIEQALTHEIIGGFYTVYNELGYGFLESVYANALSLELERRGLKVQRELPVEIRYLGQPVGNYRMDFVVDQRVLVEIKATESIGMVHRRQLFNYLRASTLPIGLLLHFGPRASQNRYISPRLLQSRR